jgi:inosine-uridine nucleoside N-ribohydrolase
MRRFTRPDDDSLRRRLEPPRSGARHRVVIDTDAANEIDDPFALAWALLAPERLQVEAVYAAPFSFAHRRREMLRARIARDTPEQASALDHELLALHRARLAFFERKGWDPATLELPSFCTPLQGMQRSHAAIVEVYAQLGLASDGRVHCGSTAYLRDADAPERSAAIDDLVARALATPADDAPLYVLALGCVTNIANALLVEPAIARHIVVVWTSGYPSHAPHANRSFNLEQDLLATRVLLASGVPLVYLPGYHVGAQLRLSLPEMEHDVRGCGAIGAYLHRLYTHNPLWPLAGIDSFHAHSWVMWDLINVAWMLEPDWVPSTLVPTPWLADDLRWQRDDAGQPMREAHAVSRDAIFGDFFRTLQRAP